MMIERTGTTKHNYSVKTEFYDNIDDFVRTCNSRKANDWAEYDRGQKDSYDSGFTGGVDTYEEALNLLEHGWKDKVDEIKKKYERFTKDGVIKRDEIVAAPVGFAPIVPNYLIGVPNSMLNIVKNDKKAKVVDIMVDFGVPARIDAEEVIDKGIKLISKIASLEKSGYRVKLTAAKAFTSIGEKKAYICNILLKSESQPIDLQRIAFPLFHPAMFRIMMFDWYERVPNATRFCGYGVSLGYSDMRDDLVDYEKKEGQILIHFSSDLDEVFNQYK